MQCPVCKLNIKDDATMCMHCGTSFQNNNVNTQLGMYQQPQTPQYGSVVPQRGVQPTSQQPVYQQTQFIPRSNTLSITDEQRDSYLAAYAGFRYNGIRNSQFSIGTFFLGWLWLAMNRLYSKAFKMWLVSLGIRLLASVITGILIKAGIIRVVLLLGVSLSISIYYALQFPTFYLERANAKINEIIYDYSTEEDRLKACKKAGKLNFWIPIIVFIIIPLLYYLFFAAIIGAIITHY